MAILADLLRGILEGVGTPQDPQLAGQNRLAMIAGDAGTAGPIGSEAYQNALSSLSAPQQPVQAGFAPSAPQGQGVLASAPQAAMQPSGGGFGDFLGNLFDPQRGARNRTVDYLRRQGLDDGTATLLAGNKGALQSYLLQRARGNGPTEFDQRAVAAQQYGLDPNSDEGRAFILSGRLPESRGGAAELGLNPQYGVDANGNPVLLQLSKDGKVIQPQMPEGVTLSKEPIKLDAGTQWVLLDPITRQPIGQVPKDLAGAETQKAVGKAQGEAAFDLPRIQQNSQQTLDLIEKLKNHPGRAGSTGFVQGRLPAYSGETQDFQALLAQAQGQTFLQAYQTLKGGGQITEVEGKKAENAIARLQRTQSDEAFVQALTDFEDVIRKGLERARRQAGHPAGAATVTAPSTEAQPSPGAGAPAIGAIEGGYRFKGGNPADRNSWERVQ